jgi:C-terminal processing protease CtpA/Prc
MKTRIIVVVVVAVCLIMFFIGGVTLWLVYRSDTASAATSSEKPAPLVAEAPGRSAKPDRVTGVGVLLARDAKTHKWMVTRVFPGSPAAKASLPTGVLLDRIDEALVDGLRIKEVSARLLGPVGTKVTLEVIDPTADKTNRLELVREVFENKSR